MSTGLRFQAPEVLLLLWSVPLLAAFVWLALRRAQRRRAAFSALWGSLSSVSDGRRSWKAFLTVIAFTLMIVALGRPSWDAELITVRQRARDIAIVVDVSQSMLAQDVTPSRLERAKLAITEALPTMQGDRVAVVAFAGSSRIVAPLTRDFHFVEWAVESLNPRSVEAGGSLMGDAVRKVAKDVFDPRIQRRKEVVLISDGGDQGSFPREAAAAAAQEGIRLITIGVGNPNSPSAIPISEQDGEIRYLRNNGSVVRTRLQPQTLRAMARATPEGRYIAAETGSLNLEAVYTSVMGAGGEQELGEVEIYRQIERYQIFLFAAFLLLVAGFVLSDSRERLI